MLLKYVFFWHVTSSSHVSFVFLRNEQWLQVWLEFQDAACLGAAAISGGHVPPINGAEPSRQHVYVFNGTFFSYGVDSKDAYKVTTSNYCMQCVC